MYKKPYPVPSKKHPKVLNEKHIQSFLTHPVVHKNYSPSNQSHALNAIVFLYKEVPDQQIGDFSSFIKAKTKSHIPVVFSKNEAKTIILKIQGTLLLIIFILYGSSLRLMEALRLRFRNRPHTENDNLGNSKGNNDRFTLLPGSVKAPIGEYIDNRKKIHNEDLFTP